MTNSTSCVWPYCVNNSLPFVEVVRRSFLSVYVPLSKQAILAWKQALVLKMFAAWKLFQAQAGPGSHIGLHNPSRIWPISFQKLHFWINPFQWLTRSAQKYIIIIDCTGTKEFWIYQRMFTTSAISTRPIYYFNTWAIIWHDIVSWFVAFPPVLPVAACWYHKIVLHIKTRKGTQVSKV